MKKIYNIFWLGLVAVMLTATAPELKAQKNKEKVTVVELSGRVTDTGGNPVAGAVVQSDQGAVMRYTDSNGQFTIPSRSNGTLLIEAFGYNDAVVNVLAGIIPQTIHLHTEGIYASERDILKRADGGTTLRRDVTSAISAIPVYELVKYPDLQLSNTLQGRAPGLVAIAGNGGLGYNTSSLYIRGQSTNGTSAAIVIIDGIERPIDDILPEEIESIEVLKDAAAKILYGSRATNGVVLIRTKRGEAHKRLVRVGVEYGVQPSSRVPEFLGAYDYANLYNEARVNDGMKPFYTPTKLEGYRNSSGVNDIMYPNVDYYKEFLRGQNTYRKATVEFNGGSKTVQYAMMAGYTGGSGLENVGKRSDLNRMSARGNLDIAVTDFLTVSADVAGRIESKAWGAKDGGGIFGILSTNRPNEYPFIISQEYMAGNSDLVVNQDGTPLFGASTNVVDNLYADMVYGGETEERYVNSQTNLGLDFDFDKYVKGLTAEAYVTFDNYSFLRHQQRDTYPTYAIDSYLDENNQEVVRFTQMKALNKSAAQNISSNQTYRNFGWRANVGYARTLNNVHDLSAVAAYRYIKSENSGSTQDLKDQNTTLRLNYSYDKRYIVEASLALMSSNRFKKSERHFLGYAASAAWVISNEVFMRDAGSVDFLKLRAGYGRLGYAGDTGYFLYRTAWSEDGTYSFTPAYSNRPAVFTRLGNPGLSWEYSDELNVGIEGLFLNKRLNATLDLFTEKRNDIIALDNTATANVVGNFISYKNVGAVANRGIEASLQWNQIINSDLSYKAGVNFSYSKNELKEWGELPQTEAYRTSLGRPTSALWGLESMGLFGRNVDIGGHPDQTFGSYQSGDIAYADLNGDGVVDDSDVKYIGQSFPLTSWGINFEVNYKGFGLYVLGTIHTGMTGMLTNSYYWNRGLGSYSAVANDRYHAVNNPGGSMPRLTVTEGQNNYRDSDFWAENTSFFRLKNIELSYTLKNMAGKGVVRNYKIYVRGTNLWTVSAIKDLDPERLDAGLSNYPAYTTITGGVSVSF